MDVRFLFMADGKPVPRVRVRAPQLDDLVEADAQGQISLPMREGNQELAVYHEGSWVPRIVSVQQNSSLLLVELNEPDQARGGGGLGAEMSEVSFLHIGRLDLGDRYVFEEVLGRGGMGLVVKAKDRLLNRAVAIKLLSDELRENDEAQQIFLTEARHLATLTHPNLVTVHDIAKAEDRVFIVIEYIKGDTIERLISSLGQLSEPVALKLSIQLARVVAYLHDQGIVHRDLKPANTMVGGDGTLKLIDFGLARHFDELFIKGTRVRGTPAYMSPEQIAGANPTVASDIYQLGVCLFEMVTGTIPFSKGDIAYAHIHTPAPRAKQRGAHISGEFDELIASCLHKDPADRPRDVHAIMAALQRLHHAADVAMPGEDSAPRPLEQSDREKDSLLNLRLRNSEMHVASPKTPGPASTDERPASPPREAEPEDGSLERAAPRRAAPLLVLVAALLLALGVVALLWPRSEPEPIAPIAAASPPELIPAAPTPAAPPTPAPSAGAPAAVAPPPSEVPEPERAATAAPGPTPEPAEIAPARSVPEQAPPEVRAPRRPRPVVRRAPPAPKAAPPAPEEAPLAPRDPTSTRRSGSEEEGVVRHRQGSRRARFEEGGARVGEDAQGLLADVIGRRVPRAVRAVRPRAPSPRAEPGVPSEALCDPPDRALQRWKAMGFLFDVGS